MTKIPSVAERVEEKFNGSDIFWKVILKHLTPETIAFIKNDYIETLTADRLTLLTELREMITKKLTTRTYKVITQYEPNTIASITIPANQESAYSLGSTITLKDLQAHLDELIKSNSERE